MSIHLKPEQQRVIALAVRSGAYRNLDEVLDRAFDCDARRLGKGQGELHTSAYCIHTQSVNAAPP